MTRLIAILFTLFPVLFASGEAVWTNVGTVLRTVGHAQGKIVMSSLPSPLILSATYHDDATDYPYEASLDFRAKAPLEDTPGASVAGPFDLIGDKLQPIDSTKISPSITPGGSLKPLFSYSADYAYDANGNMTQDRHSSITSIAYNVLNLPQTVTYEGIPLNRPVSQIVYDASGKKHIVRNGRMVGTRFNGDETRYIGQYIMVNDTIDRLQTPYGYLRDGVFHAYVFDYQGNVMAVVAGNNVVQTNLYYPDGLPMNTSTGTTANAFKYTAKELSLFRGLPVYDYTARHTLPAGGNMFRTMDPFAEKYHGISPYTFCAGDPINITDPTGMDLQYLGDLKDLNSLQSFINEFFQGSYELNIDENGFSSLNCIDASIELNH
ncbi:MAG: hypothetical protein HDR90_10615 [Bacteroides sp.]|nr:hypothetical protein [Bacteroides sp.]